MNLSDMGQPKKISKKLTSSIFFVLETRTTKVVNNIIEKNITSGWREKKCFSSGPPTPTRGHLERVELGQKIFFLIFVI
jgi:hypothetical protein